MNQQYSKFQKVLLTACVLFFLFGKNGLAQEMYTLDLKTCVQKAIEHSAAVQKALMDKESIQHKIDEQKQAMYPQLNTYIDLSGAPILPTQILDGNKFGQTDAVLPVQVGRTWNLQLGLTANQRIFDESARRSVPAAKLGRQLMDYSLKKSENEVAFQAAQLFFGLLKSESMVAMIEANDAKLAQLEASATLLAKNELATTLDAKRLQVARANLGAKKTELLNAIRYQKDLIRAFCKITTDKELKLKHPEQPLFVEEPMPQTAVEERLLNGAMERTKTQIYAQKASAFPTLNAYASAGVQAPSGDANFFSPQDRWYGMMVFGLRAQSPIFDASRHKVKQLELEMRKHEADLEQFRTLRTVEIEHKKTMLQSAQKQLELMKGNVALAEEVASTLELQYKEGLITVSEVMDAQTALTEAKANVEQAHIDVNIAELEVLKTTGNLFVLW